MPWQDARIAQIAFLSLFLGVGWVTRDWTLQPQMVLVFLGGCVATQGLFLGVQQRFWPTAAPPVTGASWVLSPLITGLGLSLLLRADHYSTALLAATVAIASKFLIRLAGKHVFNPANVGIIAALLLTPDAWVSPGQWGTEAWYALLFLGTGGLVLQRVGRWDTTVAFLASYAGLEAVRNVWLGWHWDVWSHRLMSGSLLLFALFMVTDPRTIPNARAARVLWAIAIALLTFILRNQFFLSTAVFWALFVLAPLTPLLDRGWSAPRFHWSRPWAATSPTATDAPSVST